MEATGKAKGAPIDSSLPSRTLTKAAWSPSSATTRQKSGAFGAQTKPLIFSRASALEKAGGETLQVFGDSGGTRSTASAEGQRLAAMARTINRPAEAIIHASIDDQAINFAGKV
ncbi:MAG: hypothetical protein ACR65U_11095 [Methylocystis sp.]